MARPITWQDVAAPNNAAALNASAQAGDMITNALQGLAGVARGEYDQRKADATKEAVAGILSSNDPLAAASAAPKNWAVDPLAVAQAAQQADGRLRQNAAMDASLDASKASTETARAQLEDLTSTREAATMASPMIDQIIKNKGKLPSIDLNSADWSSAAGNKAYAQVLAFKQDYDRNALQAEDMHLRRQTALKDKAKEDAFGWARSFGASPEGQSLDPAEVDRRITAEFQRRGVSEAYVGNGAQFFEQGATANRATDNELDREVPNKPDATYYDINSGLSTRARDLNQQKTAAVSKFDRAVRGQELAAGTVFTGPVAGIPAKLATAIDDDEDEARDRINRIKSKYPNITDFQAADIALATKDRWNTWVNNPANAPEAQAMAESFAAFNKIGGSGGLAKEIERVSSPFDRELNRLPILQRQVQGAARLGKEVPTEAANIVKAYRDREAAEKEAAATAAQKAVDDAAAAQKALDEANKNAAQYQGRPSYLLGQ